MSSCTLLPAACPDVPTCLHRAPAAHPAHPPGIFQGLLPSFRAFYQEAGSRQGHYPELLAFLDLVSELLRARHTGGPLAAYVLWVLHELLPSHPLLPFRSADARWAVTAAILKVWGRRECCGACVHPWYLKYRVFSRNASARAAAYM